MKSVALPKVLHSFAGRSLLGHALAATADLDPVTTAVVIGHRRDEVAAHLSGIAPDAVPVVQAEQNGTGHAVRTALDEINRSLGRDPSGTVLVLPGDAPLLTPASLRDLLAEHAESGAAATLLTSVLADPTGYGRVIRDPNRAGAVQKVVEHKDASPAELDVAEVSALVYAFDAELLRDAVGRLSTDNAQHEEYLPEVVSIFVAEGRDVRARLAPAVETAGVNDRVQLAAAHRSYNARLLDAHMRNGVTVIDPATTWVDADVRLAADVTLHPNVQLHGSTRIDSGAVIGPDSTLTDTDVGAGSVLQRTVAMRSRIGAGVTVGPFAYLRPGTELADQVHIGTYVEIKGSDVGTGSKVPHLSYVGDASIGEHTNIGAATVFVNYDGVHKHRSTIGSHARTGADNMFVAPVHVGDGAYTAAGSVITLDVPPGALAVGRAKQRNVASWVLRRRGGTAAAAAAQAAGAGEDDEQDNGGSSQG
ncbi:MAG: bifunctional UDP-N-acetylglucosamine diphosphorylase/glucosamine-1-phosphate N-acetyltransferase GlmU [Actinomycetota bacterium]|nr:bifunctional UDP-N-acetylglucosamine diphosphorylase/glucosamine-1-phosphate N-acetyltransferase GlmU [Actinomycetota bacterium]MDQ2958516.1 bifunctional UDP-N-acetylglucosamine diphosphorylase/glucosamine-1-phosphate N-acetyltransferase GlmU [Actinomycetota bacterium]